MAMSSFSTGRKCVFLVLVVLGPILSGCAKPPAAPPAAPPPVPIAPPPKPTVLELSLSADPQANPDIHGRPSPVVVHFFELRNVDKFNDKDFFSIADEKETFGNDLVAREKILLQPGERRQYQRKLQDETRHVAVAAAYRDIGRSLWRASMPVKLNATTPVVIDLRESEVSIGPK
jgi:type VI secretion system protein VasD